MNANPKFLAATAEVDAAAVAPLPKSRRVYEVGSRPDIRVPFREIEQDDTPTMFGGEKNPPLTVYDCSGPYTDPDAKIDIRRGLPEVRRAWIDERGDTEVLSGPTSDYGQERLTDPKLTAMRFDLQRPPRVSEFFNTLMDYAEETRWGKRSMTREEARERVGREPAAA